MAAKYQTTHEVAYYECDVNQTMTFPAMLGIAIKTSEEQSAALNRGPEVIASYGLSHNGDSFATRRGADPSGDPGERIQ